MSRAVGEVHGVIIAVREHVLAQDTLACRNKGVGIEESADLGIVITGLEVVQLRFLGIVLATEAKMVAFRGLLEHSFLT